MSTARNARVSFVLLFGLMGGYTLLETARDALFLGSLSTKSLPWAYLLTALGVTIVALVRRANFAPSRRKTAALIAVTAVVSFLLRSVHTRGGLYAVYSIVGVAATLLLVDVWTLVGAELDVGKARRLFAWIAAGGTLGSIVASLGATHLLATHGPHHLLSAGAIVLGVTALCPLLLTPVKVRPTARFEQRGAERYGSYGMLLFWMVSVATMATTFVDFAFKDEVVRRVSANGLGGFFARYQLILHAVELVMQVLIAPFVMRRVSADRLVLVLPFLFVVLGLGLTAMPGLALAAVLKIADGSLRNSIHRTSTEVLYQPLPIELRGRIKTLVDGVGQRGAQAVTSVVLLGVFAVHGTSTMVALLLTATSAIALILAAGVRRPYVRAFLDRLSRRPHPAAEALDDAALERLIQIASATNESRALAAIETLVARGEGDRVPTALVGHPSPAVARRVLKIVGDRADVCPLLAPLLANIDAEVRASAALLYARSCADLAELARLAQDPQPEVRAAGLVGQVRMGRGDHDAVRALVQDPATRRAALQAIAAMPHASLSDVVQLPYADADTQLDAARALAACGDARWTMTAISLLHAHRLREDVRQLLVAGGARAQDAVTRALFNDGTPVAIRRHLPRTLSRFQTPRAARLLLSYLRQGRGDGVTLYKALRGLGRMRSTDPGLKLDHRVLHQLARDALRRTEELKRWRRALLEQPPLALIEQLLHRKILRSSERLFRYLDLLKPRQGLEDIYRNLVHERGERRAASRELLEHVADPDLVDDVLALVDGTDDEPRMSIAAALDEMSRDKSRGLRALVAEHDRNHHHDPGVRHAS